MTGFELCTVAWSCHEAITVLNRPLSAQDIHDHLERLWNPRLERSEVDEALAELVTRERLVEADGLYDTRCRDTRGRRCSPPGGRIHDPLNPNFGWF